MSQESPEPHYDDITIFTTEDGQTRVEVRFQKDRELDEKAVTEESSATAADGKNYRTKFYNLEVIRAARCRRKDFSFRDGCIELALGPQEPGNRQHRENASYLPFSGQKEPAKKLLGCSRCDSRVPLALGKTRRRGLPFSHHTKCRHRRFPAEQRGGRIASRSAAFCEMGHQVLMADLLGGIALHVRLPVVEEGFKLGLAGCRHGACRRFPKPCGQLAAILWSQLHRGADNGFTCSVH